MPPNDGASTVGGDRRMTESAPWRGCRLRRGIRLFKAVNTYRIGVVPCIKGEADSQKKGGLTINPYGISHELYEEFGEVAAGGFGRTGVQL